MFFITSINISGYTQHCSNSFCEAHLKPLPQPFLTSNCIHEEDGKYVMLPTQYAKYALWQDSSDSLLAVNRFALIGGLCFCSGLPQTRTTSPVSPGQWCAPVFAAKGSSSTCPAPVTSLLARTRAARTWAASGNTAAPGSAILAPAAG